MIKALVAILCLGVLNACDPTLSGMAFSGPYVYTMFSRSTDYKITHTRAQGNACGCGTIQYVWTQTEGTDGYSSGGRLLFNLNYVRTDNFIIVEQTSGGGAGQWSTWSVRAEWTSTAAICQAASLTRSVNFSYQDEPSCTITAMNFASKQVRQQSIDYTETGMWTVTGNSWCPGVTYSLTLLSSVSNNAADLTYFTLSLTPQNTIRVTANPTLATQAGAYQLRVTAVLSSNKVIQTSTDFTFTIIAPTLTLSPTTNSVIIGNTNPTDKTFGPSDTIQTPASGFTIKYSVTNSAVLPKFISVNYGANQESVTISVLALDRTLKSAHPSTVVTVTATPVEMPAIAVTTTYTILLEDPCDNTVLTGPTPQPMTTTALRVAPETQQILLAQITDSVSYQYGSGSGIDFCYQRSFSISSIPPQGKSQLTALMLTIDSTGLISVNTNLIIDHNYVGVHTVTVIYYFSQTKFIIKSFDLTISECEVTNLTLNTPYTSDLIYTIGDPSKEWTYTAKIEPLCPYTISLQFSSNLPTSIVSATGAQAKLTAWSLNRNDATAMQIELIAKVDQQASMTVPFRLKLQIVDPCLTTSLSDAKIPELVAFQGYSVATLFEMQITDSKSNQVATLNPGVKEFCGPVDFNFYCNMTLVRHISGQNFDNVVFSPTTDTAAGVADCYLQARLTEVESVSKKFKFNATTLAYSVTPIMDQTYYVGSTHMIPFTKFQIYPTGYYDLSNYTLHMSDRPQDLKIPLDLTLLRDLDTNYFAFDASRELITIFNQEQNLPQPFFHLVLTNIIDQVILWSSFRVEIKHLTFNEPQNTAPVFTSQLTPIHVVEQCKKRPTISWSYKLPGLVDLEGDQVLEPQVQFFSEAILYNQKRREFNQEMFVDKPTNVTVQILVEDSRLATKIYDFQIQFLCFTNFTANFSGNFLNQTARKAGNPPTAFIQSIQPNGLLTIRFSTQMAVPDNAYQLQNGTVFLNETEFPALDIQVRPGAYSDPFLLKMNTTFVSFSPSQMKIQLDFANPLVVSSSIYSKDSIEVTIYGNSWFMDVQGNFMVEGFRLKSYVLPTMITQQAAAKAKKTGESAKLATASALASSAFINFVMAGPLQHMLSLVRTTQIQLHLLLIEVSTPASASIFFAQLMSLLTFQLIDLTDYLTDIMRLDEVEPLNNQFRVLGYESLYVIINLGALFFIVFVPYLLWILVFIIVKYCKPQYQKFKKKLTDTVFFNKAFGFLSETYLLFAVSASLNMHYLLWNSWGNVINSLFAILLLATVAIFPLVVYLIYTKKQNQKYIRDREQTGKEFMEKFGLIVTGLNVHRYGTKPISYLYFDMLRKLWLVSMLVFMQKYVFWSVIIVNVQAILMIAIVASVKPFTIQNKNNIELFNEFFILVINYHLMMFTDFVQDLQTRELIGNSLVYLTGGNLAINVLLILVDSLKKVFQKVKLHLARLQNIRKAEANKKTRRVKKPNKKAPNDVSKPSTAQMPAQQLVKTQQVQENKIGDEQSRAMTRKLVQAKLKQQRLQRHQLSLMPFPRIVNETPIDLPRTKILQPPEIELVSPQPQILQLCLQDIDPRSPFLPIAKPAPQEYTLPAHLQKLVDQNNFDEIDRVTRGQHLSYNTQALLDAKRLSFQQQQRRFQQPDRQAWQLPPLQIQETQQVGIPRLPRGPDKEEFDSFVRNYGKEKLIKLAQMEQKKLEQQEQRSYLK